MKMKCIYVIINILKISRRWDLLLITVSRLVWVCWHGEYLWETSMRSRFISIAIFLFYFRSVQDCCNCKQSISLSTLLSWVESEKVFPFEWKNHKVSTANNIFTWKFDWFSASICKNLCSTYSISSYSILAASFVVFSQFPWWNYFSHKLPAI